jgi:hypothetical protein
MVHGSLHLAKLGHPMTNRSSATFANLVSKVAEKVAENDLEETAGQRLVHFRMS